MGDERNESLLWRVANHPGKEVETRLSVWVDASNTIEQQRFGIAGISVASVDQVGNQRFWRVKQYLIETSVRPRKLARFPFDPTVEWLSLIGESGKIDESIVCYINLMDVQCSHA